MSLIDLLREKLKRLARKALRAEARDDGSVGQSLNDTMNAIATRGWIESYGRPPWLPEERRGGP